MVSDRFYKCTPECVYVLALNRNDLETMSGERLGDLVAFEIFRWVSSDGDIVVINDEFHIQFLGNCEASRLSVVSLLLGAIGAKTEDILVAISKRDAVNHRPHVSETARREFDTWRKTELRVTWQLRFSRAIMEEVLHGDMSFKRGEKVLRRDAVT